MQKQRKKKKMLKLLVLLIAAVVFGFSAYRLFDYISDSRKTQKAVDTLIETGIIDEKPEAVYEAARKETDSAAGSNGQEKELVTLELPFTVDFDTLREQNKDIAGWLYCEDTAINYPVMVSLDNEDYLHHRPDGTYAYGGSLFIDCRNKANLGEFNTVIYGHNMKDGSMFGSLRKYRDESYCREHPLFYYFSPFGNYVLYVVGAFDVMADSYIYEGIRTESEKEQFLYDLKALSGYSTATECGLNDRYITLSTCTNESEEGRFVVVCRMTEIKIEER